MKQIVIMPGGFHPFHAGHYELYKSALKAFPDADMYVAATNDQKVRPFPFEIKEKLAKLAGVKPGSFVQVKSPFMPKEITQNYDPEQDIVIFVRSEKDRTEQPKPGGTKKDGSPAYFQAYTGKDLEPFGKHAYIHYLPTVEFGPGIKSATEIRNAWPKLNKRQKTAMVMSLYPVTQQNRKLADTVVKMLDIGMGGESEPPKKLDERVDYLTEGPRGLTPGTPMQDLIGDYGFFATFNLAKLADKAKPGKEQDLKAVQQRAIKSAKVLELLKTDREKLQFIHDMIKYIQPHMKAHMRDDEYEIYKPRIQKLLDLYKAAAAGVQESFTPIIQDYLDEK